jgi:hypothetical protein
MQPWITPHTPKGCLAHCTRTLTRHDERFCESREVELQFAREDVLDEGSDGGCTLGSRGDGVGGSGSCGARSQLGEFWRVA